MLIGWTGQRQCQDHGQPSPAGRGHAASGAGPSCLGGRSHGLAGENPELWADVTGPRPPRHPGPELPLELSQLNTMGICSALSFVRVFAFRLVWVVRPWKKNQPNFCLKRERKSWVENLLSRRWATWSFPGCLAFGGPETPYVAARASPRPKGEGPLPVRSGCSLPLKRVQGTDDNTHVFTGLCSAPRVLQPGVFVSQASQQP